MDDSSVSLGKCILSLTAGRHNSARRRLVEDSRNDSRADPAPIARARQDLSSCKRQVVKAARRSLRIAVRPDARRISDGDARVAHEAAPLRALHGAAAKQFAKFFFAQRNQPFQVRRKKRIRLRAGAAGNSPAALPARGGSTGKRPGRCRTRIHAAPLARAIRRESRRAIQSSGRKCSAARRARTVRRWRRSGTRRCTGCSFRTNPERAFPQGPAKAANRASL